MTDITELPLEAPAVYDPDAERWVNERENPHAPTDQLYAQAEIDPTYTVDELNPYDPEEIDWTPPEIIDGTPDVSRYDRGHPGTEHFQTAYTNYTPPQQTVGQVAVNMTAAMLALAIGATADIAAGLSRTPLRTGPGVLVGYMATSNGAGTTKFIAIVDAVNDDGPIIAILNTGASAPTGMVSLGHDGIQFNKGLTLINLGANPFAVIPVIRREVPTKLGER